MAACRMSDFAPLHTPVLLDEVLANLLISREGKYVDATFGRGSHSRAILAQLGPQGRLYAFDKDPEAVSYAKQTIQDPRFQIFHASFATLASTLTTIDVFGQISGVLFDLGVSSPQLDTPDRGFSFMREGPLDMRMDTTQGIDAKTWLAQVEEDTLANVLWQYGEERFSRRIAKKIVTARETTPITTTTQLAKLVEQTIPRSKQADKHPATRTFQAIRIAINAELQELEQGLAQALDALAISGRLAVISFHSLEDRLVKQFIKQHEKGKEIPRGLPIKGSSFSGRLKSVVKMIKPSTQEINVNPRARSAILRIAEKLS